MRKNRVGDLEVGFEEVRTWKQGDLEKSKIENWRASDSANWNTIPL